MVGPPDRRDTLQTAPAPTVAGTYDIVARTATSDDYRHVVATGPNSQLVTMCLQPDVSIGMEVHDDADQFLVVVNGTCTAIIDDTVRHAGPGDLIYVPAGAAHDIINAGHIPCRLYTIYTLAEHPDGLVQPTKESAAEYEAAHDH